MTLLLIFILNYSFNTVSIPISYYTLSNPAFTAHSGNYQVYIEPKDIGDIAVFNCSAKLNDWGLGFSNMDEGEGYEQRNWGSIAHHFKGLPLSFGLNLGINRRNDNTNALFDVGAWFRSPLSFGFCFGNVLNDEKIIRFGASFTWKKITGTFEIEDSIRYEHSFTPHALISYNHSIGDFTFEAIGGHNTNYFVIGFGLGFREFINGQVLHEDATTKVLLGIKFRPPVIIKEVAVVETLLVKKPVIIEKTIIKEGDEKTPSKLSKKDEKYCEEHYLKGIDYYVNNELKQAIKEWNRVIKVCPNYKDAKRYLANAREKLKLLEN